MNDFAFLLILPLTLIVLSIPLILGRVPRNEWYGFRIPRTMASDEVWYRANRLGGQYYLAAGIVMLPLFALLAWLRPTRLVGGWLEPTILLLPLAVATVLWYLRVRRL